jgi:hypothetical protein
MNKTQKAFSVLLLISASQAYAKQDLAETIVENVAHAVAVAADAVKDGAQATKNFAEGATAKVGIVAERSHAKEAHERAGVAWQERDIYQQETAVLKEHTKLVKNEIEQKEAELKHAKEALLQAQEALYIRESVVPLHPSETFVDKVEEAAVATKDMVVDTARATKDAVVDVASSLTETIKSAPAATKFFVASTSAKAQTIVQEVRADHAAGKAETAFEEKQKNAEKLARLYKKRDIIQNELTRTHQQTRLAHQALTEAQRVAIIKNEKAQ